MGRAPRLKPVHLGSKLLQIRLALGMTQDAMIARLGVMNTLTRASISTYESGLREPPLPVLLMYSQLANVYVEVLIDDRVNLPEKIPAAEKSEGIPSMPKVMPRQRSRSLKEVDKNEGRQR